MRKIPCFSALIAALLFPVLSFAQAPQQIAGIRLGDNLDQYRNILRMDTSLPVRHMEYISEVELKPSFEGYRSGYIFYGNCDKPGRIVKIKLKYERSDKEFFEDLLQRFKQKFGEPDQYRGDAFRAFIAWKWSFRDKDGNTYQPDPAAQQLGCRGIHQGKFGEALRNIAHRKRSEMR